jgi:hypothetical protein
MLNPNALKNIGYTINNGTFGTVNVKVSATAKFNPQLIVSNDSLSGLLCQSALINLIAL